MFWSTDLVQQKDTCSAVVPVESKTSCWHIPRCRSVWAKSMLLLLQRVAEYLSLDFKVATLCVATPDLTAWLLTLFCLRLGERMTLVSLELVMRTVILISSHGVMKLNTSSWCFYAGKSSTSFVLSPVVKGIIRTEFMGFMALPQRLNFLASLYLEGTQSFHTRLTSLR